jgi:serine/threonine protein phosphatase PrpC
MAATYDSKVIRHIRKYLWGLAKAPTQAVRIGSIRVFSVTTYWLESIPIPLPPSPAPIRPQDAPLPDESPGDANTRLPGHLAGHPIYYLLAKSGTGRCKREASLKSSSGYAHFFTQNRPVCQQFSIIITYAKINHPFKGVALSSHTAHNDPQSPVSFQISSHGVTDTGHVRTKNEDSILVNEDENIWIIADGMGGHQAGDFASQTITNNLSLFKQHASLDDSILLLEENILNSNAIIRKKSLKLGRNATIGSTVVCVYVWRNLMFVLWAGDSRLYRYRDARLERLTEDHSYVEELVRMGKIEARDAEEHPAANVVLKAVGIDDHLCIDFEYYELRDGDIYIICSDGLYKDLDETRIGSTIEAHPANMDELSDALLEASLAAGGTDNTSIIAMKIMQKENDV